MSRFFVIALSIFGGTHFYLWLRLVSDTALGTGWYAALSALTLLLFALIPLTFAFGRRVSSRFGAFVVWPGYIWLGTLFLLFVAVVGVDLVRAVVELSAWALGAPPPSAEEQLAHARLGAAVAASAAAVALAFALWSGRRLVVKRVPVELSRLPEALHGSTIVQLTDVHIGPTLGKAFLERVVAAVNSLNPDVVVITGDLVDGSVARLREAVAPLAHLQARHGVF
ncbi:MAG TPA: metallophosphoesterase, partial [Polyangiaceae bacterium]|nr:metallophosphoesterase [Polyangiaceae bacterium]